MTIIYSISISQAIDKLIAIFPSIINIKVTLNLRDQVCVESISETDLFNVLLKVLYNNKIKFIVYTHDISFSILNFRNQLLNQPTFFRRNYDFTCNYGKIKKKEKHHQYQLYQCCSSWTIKKEDNYYLLFAKFFYYFL